MIFSELYGAYYNAVAAILESASDHPLKKDELRGIVEREAFGESILNISSALEDRRWQLLNPEGKSTLRHLPTMPLTSLEKSWLNAIYNDPRVRLFTNDTPLFPEIEPLFRQDDLLLFDRYADGDSYEDEGYIQRFRLILDAIANQQPLQISMRTAKGRYSRLNLFPEHLEYSEKDDKFRLIGVEARYGKRVVNLGRITDCSLSDTSGEVFARHIEYPRVPEMRTIIFELRDERKALERVLLHFAHFRKEAERLDDERYRISVTFDAEDETEMVIRILSFGPMIRVTSPTHFVELIKQRLIEQKNCGL